MRSQDELALASGYGSRPRELDILLRTLDHDVRLITPTDPEGVAGDEGRVAGENSGAAGDEWRVAGATSGVGGENSGMAEDGRGVAGIERSSPATRTPHPAPTGENTDESAALPIVGSVAVRHGAGGEVLSGDQRIPETGAVWTDKSDPTIGGVDPGKHRGGTGEGAHQGIPQPSEHGPGIVDGAGNTPDVEPAGRDAATGGTRELVGADRPRQPDAQRPTQGAGKTPGDLTATHPATRHSPPSTLFSPATRHSPPSTLFSPATRHSPPSTRYYQLTHDYLVPSIRDWLTRKQRETRRGRAELRLAERSALWNARPENRHLPSVLEWANIRLLTKRTEWTKPERRMMRQSGMVHGSRAFGVAVLIVLATGVGSKVYGNLRAGRWSTRSRRLARRTFPRSWNSFRATGAGLIRASGGLSGIRTSEPRPSPRQSRPGAGRCRPGRLPYQASACRRPR